MRIPSTLRALLALVMAVMIGLGSLISPALAEDSTPAATPAIPTEAATPESSEEASPEASTPAASPVASPVEISGTVDLDVLFVGAHPDDEAGGLSTYGQWNEYDDVQVGVITVTRGEGGGNAVGTEEGPALGLLREAEERNAVGMANVEHIYNLDKVDFYYTVSAQLAAETWGYDETLEKVVRVIRTTKPEIIITMNPSPTPGQHGHHQVAGRLAIDAFYAAADPNAFPGQITDEGLSPWRASRIMQSGAAGQATPGPQCAETYQSAEATDVIWGVWSGTESEANDATWAKIERTAQQSYASQGWAAFPDVSDDPNELGCDYFTLIDSRAPFDAENTSTTAILEGAVLPVEGGLPLGTEFYLTTSAFDVAAGQPFDVTAHLRSSDSLTDPVIEITLPDGWEMSDPGEPAMGEDGDLEWTVQVTPAADAAANTRFRIDATVTAGEGSAATTEVVEVAADVAGTLEPLAEVAYFREWVDDVDVPQLDNLIFPVFSMGAGQTRDVTIDLTNMSADTMSGSVSLDLPEGFTAEPASQDFADLSAEGTGQVTFSVTNTDASLPTSNEGGDNGNYPFTITTTTDSGASTEDAGINLVPVTTVPRAETAPAVDGTIDEGEYTGDALNLSRIWEGQPLDGPEDASGTAYVTWGEDGVYVAVDVTDDVLGTVLPENDAKRHWRTDSVEIAIDPLGTASNTSTTFKVGVFPITQEGGPAAYRDADAHQGPVAETAPGFQLASTVSEPYTGYTLEVMIPYDVLPADIDPDNATMNIFIYDSDTQDLTGQTRLGWSTWGGVQGDPYRWGKTVYEGMEIAPDARTTPDEPVMPLDAAKSVDSPLSILQSAEDGVGLAGDPMIPEDEDILVDDFSVVDGEQEVRFTPQADGTVRVFSYVDGTVTGQYSDAVSAG
ncbi:MAG TPA: sugar-binding protein, partial [Thermomicrobiales bacterium]|nr:sugar-binding protein [Thermomicrobiales bacterium]